MKDTLTKKLIGGAIVYMGCKAIYNLGKIKGSLESSNEFHGKLGKCKLHVTVHKEKIEETQV